MWVLCHWLRSQGKLYHHTSNGQWLREKHEPAVASVDERARTQRLCKAVCQWTQSIYNACQHTERQVAEFLITSSSTSCFHCWEEIRAQTRKQKTGFTFQSFRCQDTRTYVYTHTRVSRRRMRGCFSPGYPHGKKEKRKKTCKTKQWLPWRHKHSCQRASERQRAGRPGYLARRQQVTCKESQWGAMPVAGNSSLNFWAMAHHWPTFQSHLELKKMSGIIRMRINMRINDVKTFQSHQPSARLTGYSRNLGKAFA